MSTMPDGGTLEGTSDVRAEIRFKTQLHGEEADELRAYWTDHKPDSDVAKGHSEGVHLAYVSLDIVDADEVVVKTDEESVPVLISYPLEKPTTVFIDTDTLEGLTRGAFARGVQDEYERIYEEEEAEPGRYGIIGHSIDDLHLIAAYRRASSKVWKLSVES